MTEQQTPQQPYQQGNPKADAKAAKAYFKASRPWYKKKRWIALIALAVIIIIAVASNGGSGGSSPSSDGSKTSSSSQAHKTKGNTLNADAGAMNRVQEGKSYQLGDFKIQKGWKIQKTAYVGWEVKNVSVENTTSDSHQFDVAIKLHSGPGGKRIVAEIDCIANAANPGDIVDADCLPTGQGAKPYDYVTIENAV